jgi:predicted ATP-dependent endonuclease of OLD family
MILKTVDINGYKSFRKRVELHIPSKTAVLIGPNNHGKTNALRAIEKLRLSIVKFQPDQFLHLCSNCL